MPIKDPGRVAALLGIVEQVSKVGPGYTHIASEAMAELRELNQEIHHRKMAEKGQEVRPDFGDKGGPTPTVSPEAESAAVQQPTASTPVESSVGPSKEPTDEEAQRVDEEQSRQFPRRDF